MIRIASRRTVGGVEKRGAVANGPRHHVADRHAAPPFADVRTQWRAGAGRFQPDEPATRRRNTDRTAAVGGVGDRDYAGGHDGSGAAARTPGGLLQIPRVAADAEQHRLGGDVQPELRRAGATEQQQAGRAVAGDQFGVVVRHEIGEQPATGRTPQAFLVRDVLDQKRNAGERGIGQRLSRLRARLVVRLRDDRVQPRIDRLRSANGLIEHLDRAQFAQSDQSRQFQRVVSLVVLDPAHPRPVRAISWLWNSGPTPAACGYRGRPGR